MKWSTVLHLCVVAVPLCAAFSARLHENPLMVAPMIAYTALAVAAGPRVRKLVEEQERTRDP